MPQVLQPPFVGRKPEQQLYQEFLARETPWVLLIAGLGGNGKSALLAHLVAHTPSDRRVITLNFAEESLRIDTLKILEELAAQLEPHCEERRVKAFEEALDKGRSKLAELNQQMNQVIQVGDYASLKGAQLNIGAAEAGAIRERRRQVREQVLRAFYAQLDTFRPARLVMMLDTCEWLSEPECSEVGPWVLNELIRGMHARLQQKQRRCSVVIASRIQLPLELINEQEQRYLPLPMLDLNAVEEYLTALGMQDSALRQHIYAITYGHPLFVSIIGTLWQERGEQPFTVGDLPVLPEEISERARLKVHERILDKRLKSPFRELSYYGVLLRSFNLPLLRAVFPELLPESEAPGHFNQLIQYPYIKYLGNRRYAFHDLLREMRAEEIREQEPEKWKLYHKRALDHLSAVPHIPDWYYHALAHDEEQGMTDWWQALQEAQIRGLYEQLGALLKVAYDETLKLTPASCAKRAYRQGRFYYYTEQWKKAMQSYEQALTFCQQTRDRLGEANNLKAMGDVLQASKDLQGALQYYGQALLRYQKADSKLGEANALQAMGDVLQANKDIQGALQNYEQALTLFQQENSSAGEANVRKAMGDLQQYKKDWQGALQSYGKALPLYRQAGDRLGEANVWKAMGDVQQSREDMPGALQSYGKALTLYQKIGSRSGEANVWKAMGDVQRLSKDMEAALQNYGKALPLYQQVEALSEEASVWKAMGDAQQARNEIEMQAALENYGKALALYQQVGNHSKEARVLQVMGDVQRRSQDIAGALQSYEQALSLYQLTGNRLGEANCYQALGRIALQQEDYLKALDLYTNACQLYAQMSDSYSQYSQAYSLYYRSQVYDALNKRHLAIADIDTGLEIARRLKLPFVDMFRERLAALRKSSS